ncbi:PAS domain-containing sensor histidine kinase [Mariprofundus ferrooxydans]|uniref:PAS domain-containing hybrid sensor histidine kinase/response regulator n=1 Tax=Mariprofundus ferrooxydans TaxID=314344 RepID=UPI0003794DEA|nr:PAS domain-containing sensor histidine kinase [Mariprofundus ferrooxydans]
MEAALNLQLRKQLLQLQLKKQQIKDDHQAGGYRRLHVIHEICYRADTDGHITEITPLNGTFSGYDCDHLIGQTATFFYRHSEDRKRYLELLQQHGFVADYELELFHHDGDVIHVSVNARTLFNDQDQPIGVEGILRDISERVALQRELQCLKEKLEERIVERTRDLEQQNRHLKLLLQSIEQSAEAFIITDHCGKVEYVNPAFERINGYTINEIQGKSLSLLNSDKHDADFFHTLWCTIRSGEVWEGTIINRRKDGTHYPALMTIVPVIEHGIIEHYTAIQQDMSEYAKLEAQFRQSQKMEAIGTLVGGITHDFNNMLASLLMNLYMARREADCTEKLLTRLDMAEKLGYQASDMLKDLLIFSRDDPGEKQCFEFNSMLHESLKLLQVSIPEHVACELKLCEEKLSVLGDVRRLQQVLMNMLNNARDALGSGEQGRITICLQRHVPDQEFMNRHKQVHHKVMACLSISDNGTGMTPETMARIFDPFFTTKGAGHGTGLGLSMVFGCIEDHDGVIEVESVAGEGTVFHLFLPLVGTDQPAVLPAGNKAGFKRGQGEMILVADDNELIRKAIVETLSLLNYRTLQAADGEEALALFEAHQDQLSLVILDMVMPCMSGREAARHMRLLSPLLPIMFATGHDEEEALRDVRGFENSVLCEKPFRIQQLSEDIYRLLNC